MAQLTTGSEHAPSGAAGGLTPAEVEDRRRRGLVNDVPATPTRSVGEIVRANVLTRFNALLGSLLVVVLLLGDVRDALFGLVLLANTAIGVAQELRAKRTLDRLLLVTTPRVRVVRDGAVEELPPVAVVQDDLVQLRPGDQVPVDGEVVRSRELEVDEALLTGESDPVVKGAGDEVLSGSFVVAGAGTFRATRVGAAAYAAEVTEQARRFTLFDSRLRADIDVLLRIVSWVLVPTAGLLVASQLAAHASPAAAMAASVGGVVAMVPEGLVLLTSAAFAVAVVRLGRRRTLVQELAAVEGLARADVVCMDKTGTLTRGAMEVVDIEVLADVAPAEVEATLGALAAADPDPNATLRALAARCADPGWSVRARLPFSSARKYAGADLGQHGAWLLGAPEVLLERSPDDTAAAARVAHHVADAYRVLLLAAAPGAVDSDTLARVPLRPVALVVLSDTLRPDAAEVLDELGAEDMTILVISGDDPRVVSTLAARAGLADVRPVDARRLPDDDVGLVDAMGEATVFGRVAPHQKEQMVAALQARGHVVAMLGDGVNDVLALKRADVGIAMGSGSDAARGVAQLVLLDDEFSALPAVLAEGRRVIGNVHRVARLFVTKSVYALLLALAIGVTFLPFPFLPRHLSLIGALTVGIPGTILALQPSTTRARGGLVRPVLEFAVPAGLLAAVATFSGYYVAQLEPDVALDEAQTTATVVLLAVGLLVLDRLLRRVGHVRRTLVAAMAGAMLLVLLLPGARAFFALDMPPAIVVLAGVGVVAIAERLLRLERHVPAAVARLERLRGRPG